MGRGRPGGSGCLEDEWVLSGDPMNASGAINTPLEKLTWKCVRLCVRVPVSCTRARASACACPVVVLRPAVRHRVRSLPQGPISKRLGVPPRGGGCDGTP